MYFMDRPVVIFKYKAQQESQMPHMLKVLFQGFDTVFLLKFAHRVG